VRGEIVRRLAGQIGREGGEAVSWVCSTASVGCSWWVCEAMEEERKHWEHGGGRIWCWAWQSRWLELGF
jgi:hypothetical protein